MIDTLVSRETSDAGRDRRAYGARRSRQEPVPAGQRPSPLHRRTKRSDPRQLDLFDGLLATRQPRSPAKELLWVTKLGYTDACERGPAGICGLLRMIFTGAIVVGIERQTYHGRYCYETVDAARAALAAWDGYGDPPGAWIKFKGGARERLGPGCRSDDMP